MEMDRDPPSNIPSPRGWLACWLLFFSLVLGMQYWHLAYRSDLAGDPDEAAHAVTSVMVRDYMTQGLGTPPLHYAEAYKDRLPKVALGHYPPAFYVLAGVWLLPHVSIASLLVLQAVLVATLAALLGWCAGRLLPSFLAFASGVLVCVCSPIQKIAVLVMSDVLLAIACLLAVIAFASYLDRPRAKAALAFGLAAAFAILTKGSGWMLAVVPPLAIALTGQWRLLIKPSLWVAPVPVILLALPWQLFSYKLTAGGMSELPLWQYFLMAAPFYLETAVQSFGTVLVVLLVVGGLMQLLARLKGGKSGSMEACLWALTLGGLAIVLFVPAGTSSRYFIPMVAPILIFPLLTARQIALRWLPARWACALALLVVTFSLAEALSHKKITKVAYGFHETVQLMAQAPGTTLLCADSRGEGALVAEAAFDAGLRAGPPVSMIRATKELASQDWNGRGYVLTFHDDAALREHLKKRGVRWVLLDDSVTGVLRQPHFDQLKHALLAPDSGWRLRQTLQVASGETDQGSMLVFTPTS